MKVCVITGGAGAVGVECAKVMGKREKLLLVDGCQEKLDDVVAQLVDIGIEGIEAVQCDISNRDEVRALAQKAASLGQVNSVLNLAEVKPDCSPKEIALVNGLGVYNMIEEFVEVMSESACMVTINSLSTHVNQRLYQAGPTGDAPDYMDHPEADDFVDAMVADAEEFSVRTHQPSAFSEITYGLAKYFSWRYSLRNVQRFADKGLRINTVTRGVVAASMDEVDDSGDAEQLDEAAIKRPGKPEEMAAAVCWLTEDAASIVTGIDLPVDGGISALNQFPNQVGTQGEIDFFEARRNLAARTTIFNKYGPDQLSYTVKDLDAAVQQFYELFGAGPFIKMGPLRYDWCKVRGKDCDPETVIALGMWGPMQVEFVQKLNDDDMLFDENGFGFNHINVVVDDYDEAIAFLKEHGYEPGQEMRTAGMTVAYVDTMCNENIRHHTEVHEYNISMDMTKKAREIWDGKSPWIDFDTVIGAMYPD